MFPSCNVSFSSHIINLGIIFWSRENSLLSPYVSRDRQSIVMLTVLSEEDQVTSVKAIK